jgi:hypothetical protein
MILGVAALALSGCGPGYCSVTEVDWAPSIPQATVGAQYDVSLYVSADGTWSFSMSSGSLPAGITFLNSRSSDGSLSLGLTGKPTQSGNFPFKLHATESACGQSKDHSFTLVVNPG